MCSERNILTSPRYISHMCAVDGCNPQHRWGVGRGHFSCPCSSSASTSCTSRPRHVGQSSAPPNLVHLLVHHWLKGRQSDFEHSHRCEQKQDICLILYSPGISHMRHLCSLSSNQISRSAHISSLNLHPATPSSVIRTSANVPAFHAPANDSPLGLGSRRPRPRSISELAAGAAPL